MIGERPATPADAAAELCQRCGLCCDGSLFTQVPLAEDEVDPAHRRGLVVLARADGSPALRQPCAALQGRRCAVYDARPAGCRRYRCMLLAALDERELDEREALAVVDEAHARLAALAALLPPGEGGPVQRARELARAGDLSADVRAALERALAFLDRRLRGLARA